MKTALAAVILVASLPAAAATVRHAAPAGIGDACTTAKPCALDKALRKAKCGDTVSVAGGTYAGIKIANVSCPEKKRLVVESASPLGAVLEISQGDGIAIAGSDNVTVRGFRINQHKGAGFGVQVNGGQGIVLKDVTILGDTTTCKTAPDLGDHVYAFDTKGLVLDGLNVGKVERGECNYVEDTTCFTLPRNTSLTMQNCTCHDIRNFGNFSNSSDLTIQDNVVVNLHNHGMGMVDVTGAVVQRNVFYATVTSTNIADVLWLVCSHGINFRNNLVQGTKVFPVSAFTSHPNCSNSANSDKVGNDWKSNDGIVHANNIYIDQTSPGNGQAIALWNGYWAAGTPFKSNHNLFNGNNLVGRLEPTNFKTLDQWRAAKILGLEQDAKSVTARPTFVNEAARDYRPAGATSPQVDAGDDANCAHTILGAHCDIGPFEFGGTAKRP